MTNPTTIETVIIGAGQAGLATAHHLLQHDHPCVVLDPSRRIGDNWRQQYDSLRLYSPAKYDGLPGMPFPADPWVFPGKDQMADFLEAYADRFGLPVRLRTRVTGLSRWGEDFLVTTPEGDFECRNVVVATGGHGRTPAIPECATELDPRVLQLHSSEYRRPDQLRDGPVLVVGAAHSGCDIAFELAAGAPTTLVGRDCGQIPVRWNSVPLHVALPLIMFAWRHVLTRRTPMGRRMMPQVRDHGGPMVRIKRQDLAERGVVRNPARVVGVRDGLPLLSDDTTVPAANVIWATGFRHVLDWIDLPIFDEGGWPREYRGVSPDVPGLFFCGLSFQFAFASMVLPGVGRDAAHVGKQIIARTRVAAVA